MCFAGLGDCLAPSQTVSLGISCMCSYGLDTVADCLGVSCRCPSGQRDCLATSPTVWGLLQVPRQFERRSGIVKDCLKVSCMCLDGIGTVADRL
ncbi:hypothetical protein DPMN_041400 [Dreissena polymorpha]|uniref:Uncharacterized protein n=1 Tax=Dreissena polymorpha TaxID=45954 RepID=A0A9D4CXQ1_DREPO|nr:hypothetical protein DPMN_041400 [Dreissena polymorpha]